MKVLQVHNFYKDPRGGETVVVNSEKALLESHGHEVLLVAEESKKIQSAAEALRAGLGAVYSVRSKGRLAEAIQKFRPDIVHAHNIYPLLSPSIFYACKEAATPAVMTLHNYRIGCPSGQLLRRGRICQDCIGKTIAWPGVLHACYRGSRAATTSVAIMNSLHRFIGTWDCIVGAYVALSTFQRDVLVRSGLPEERVHTKPNFLPRCPSPGTGRGGYGLYVGRLAKYKGVETLLAAWRSPAVTTPLKILGDGPLSSMVSKAHVDNPSIDWLGWQDSTVTERLLGDASFLVVPSTCPEPFGLVVIEAYARGTPVLASCTGALADMVKDGETGLHFRSGDPHDLTRVVQWAAKNPQSMERMRARARSEFERNYTPGRNYEMLMSIYGQAKQYSNRMQ